MSVGRAWFDAAAFLLLAALVSGCGGGGGGSSSAASIVPPVAATSAPQSAGTGPVEYLQNSGPLTSSGTIVAGSRQAYVAVMSGSAADGAFAADTLVVGAQATMQSSQERAESSRRASVPSRISPVEAFPANDRVLIGRRAAYAAAAPAQPVRAMQSQSVLPSVLQTGATAALWVQRGTLSGPRTNVQVPSTLLAQTTHANIWIDDSLLSGTASSPAFAPGALASTLAAIDADFENAYASDTAHFASPDYGANAPGLQPQYKACNASGSAQGSTRGYVTEPADKRINVSIVNAQNLGGLGGYFSAANYMPQSALNCLNGSGTTYESNEAPFIFAGWFDRNGASYEIREDLVRSTAHELQHLINFVNHGILASGASSPSFNGNETAFVNEGLSMLAQDFAVENMYGSAGVQFDVDDALARANVYLANPGNFSVSAFSGIDAASWGGDGNAQPNCGGGCYGGAYLFQRYLSDRFGADAYTHAVETGSGVGVQNLQAATGVSAGTLLDDFALAMAADTLGVSQADARFKFGSLKTTGTYADQFGGSRTLGGLYATPLSGTSASVQAPVGGFAFVAVPAVPNGGMPVSVTDRASVSGFGLAAGVAQH